MKLIDCYKKNIPVLSLEISPPKRNASIDTVAQIFDTIAQLVELKPGYISVTYGAGGSTRGNTVEIASRIKNDYGIESMAHLTCVGHSRRDIDSILDQMLDRGIDNILALRGDLPENQPDYDPSHQDYHYAVELIREVRAKADFCVVAAAYPEGHPESRRLSQDLRHLKEKVDAGVDFLITQMFFNNRVYYEFMERTAAIGIDVPIVPGVFPVMHARQIRRTIYLCGASIPAELLRLTDKYEDKPEEMEKAGIDYAAGQILDLLENGAPGIHFYTMNKARQAREILHKAGLA